MNKPATIKCPTCGKPSTLQPENTFRPFCSDRCKLIDLGAWANEDYRVASDPVDPNPPSGDDKEE